MKKTAHVIAHSHWDREWYLPFEKHRIKLVELMELLIETIDKDPNYGSFHLDGQTVPLEDYLEIMPHRAEKVRELIEKGKLVIGPWYILQDEFLISSEANVRNLQIGIIDSEKLGPYAEIGYFPDSFGNIGQAPQILRQAGMDTAVYGRGVKAVGFNNEIGEDNQYLSKYSEMYWESPDGSRVLAILFANWYHNGMEIPADPEAALTYWNERLPRVEAYASTPELLFMNGCDHQPLQADLSEALAVSGEVRPDIEFKHSSFPEYIEAVKAKLPEELAVIRGELRSQFTDGWNTLVNTASARVYIKQANNKTQTQLEKVTEPLAVMAYAAGMEYPKHELTYAWKTLLRNHPHDSICGCSVDEVHREMMTRFEKSVTMAEAVADRSAEWLSGQIDTSSFGKLQGAPRFDGTAGPSVPFVLFNTTGHRRSGVVTLVLDVCRHYFDGKRAPHDQYAGLTGYQPGKLAIVDAKGNVVEAVIVSKGLAFGYDLPDDRFRQPYWAYQVEVTIEANNLPPVGYETYSLVAADAVQSKAAFGEIVTDGGRVLENDILKVVIAADGSFTALDKQSGQSYSKLGLYENTGDIGNEYMYMQPVGETALTTEGLQADLEIVENNSLRGSVKLTHRWQLPVSADEKLDLEINSMTPFRERKSQRVQETREVTIQTVLTLEKGDRSVRIASEIDNTVLDHRIRMLFPTGLKASGVTVDSIYELAERPLKPEAEWINPSNAQHQQAFVSMSDGRHGVTVANKGLHEYEALENGDGTLAVTLLRSVRELGDWGVFATPEAQCQGKQTAELKLIIHEGTAIAGEAYVDAYQFQVPWTARQTDVHEGKLSASGKLIDWDGERMAVTALKVSEYSGDIMLRMFNVSAEPTSVAVESSAGLNGIYKSDILERPSDAQVEGSLEVGPAEIVTIGLKRV
ncbi:alpha-mannosidase [Paenibacillus radicis (ex Gao et al. 2016)]|uniref:Glycosyl hydrolase n=1 Tax=Paenibacillus radicis (ex Gao et al. 2016) TaxID=1737354 RepID=A0A917HR55_9BACL|nr:alpha-mannosidase [Paenibacillus radicis (ex Gao et al. 2016)]GGG86464.1 glycosyl hydrolase [Paenibacillus radicis (ex Gao et al. 2016)]